MRVGVGKSVSDRIFFLVTDHVDHNRLWVPFSSK